MDKEKEQEKDDREKLTEKNAGDTDKDNNTEIPSIH
jgi:hypothetical protein